MNSALIGIISQKVLSKTVSDTIDTLYILKNANSTYSNILESLDIEVKLEVIHSFLAENYCEEEKHILSNLHTNKKPSHSINILVKHINQKIKEINETLINLKHAIEEYNKSTYLTSGQSISKKQKCIEKLTVNVKILDNRFSTLLQMARI